MATTHNISYLGTLSMPADRPDAKVMIDVDHVTMAFNIASEQLNSLKEYAIALSRRELRFKEFLALDDVSFQVKQGDVFGILGTNGSGKSTILKIIAGVLEPTRGFCTVAGSIAPLIELGAGFDLELTARENIFLNGALLGYSKKFIQQHFEEIVDFAEVRDFLDMPMKNYSSGMVARIAFAIATVIVPDVLIVDEVLSVGDFMFQQKCERRIQSLIKDHGVTVLIVSHNNDQIERLCNKAAWIEKGHLRCIGDAREICEVYRAIGGRTGSPEAEKAILRLLEMKMELPEELIENVFGDDRYCTAVQANDFVSAPGKTVILTNSDSEAENRIASSLAGLLDASLLTVQKDRIPDVTMQEIKHGNPSKAIIIGDEEQVDDRVLEDLAHHFKELDVERIAGSSASLSYNTFAFAASHGMKWGDTAILVAGPSLASMLISPFAFTHKAPFFYIDGNGTLSEEEKSALQSFRRIIVIDPDGRHPENSIPADSDTAFVHFTEKETDRVNEEVNRWRATDLETTGRKPLESLLVTSPESVIDNHVIGPLAARLNASILLEDPQDLDSIVHAIGVAKRHYPNVRRIVYLGNEMRFSKLNRQLIAKSILA
ncbi:MAG TPA: ATP-binding cassette domain-containing protein [Candidatus Aphodovivens avistercoris]|nr:ATP-binding cassette domain-containing protein [Candidatus Aphodovivens avistercoris]